MFWICSCESERFSDSIRLRTCGELSMNHSGCGSNLASVNVLFQNSLISGRMALNMY